MLTITSKLIIFQSHYIKHYFLYFSAPNLYTSLAEVSTPTFNSATANSWLWGVMITPDNDVVQTGIINWPSHLCSFTGNGYTSGVPDGYRKVNTDLYDQIPDTDIRKQWFLSPDNTSS